MRSIAEKLAETGKWHVDTAALSVRAGHKCEYCGLDFFASVENYKNFQIDHIVPLSKGGEDNNENKAVACRVCNVDLKSRWNPLDITSGNSREELIAAVREYIQAKKNILLKEVLLMNDIAYSHLHNNAMHATSA